MQVYLTSFCFLTSYNATNLSIKGSVKTSVSKLQSKSLTVSACQCSFKRSYYTKR